MKMCKCNCVRVRTENFTDLRDDQGNLPFWPIPRLEAIAATQLTRRRFLPDKFAACMS